MVQARELHMCRERGARCSLRATTWQGFFPASELAVHRSYMDKRGPLKWPPFVLLSSDHTHPRWRFQSHRRLKNVICHVEWLPDADAVKTAPPAAVAPSMALTEAQKARLGRIFQMYDVDQTGHCARAAL